MDGAAANCGGFGEAVAFLRYFSDLPDPRQRGKVMYPLDEVLLLCLLGVLAGAETFVDIARFGDKKLELLSQSPSSWRCWRSRGQSSPSMQWAASATSLKRSSARRPTTSSR
jgi:hypothetical protein